MTTARQRLRRFYAENPDEFLTATDAAIKVGVCPTRARMFLRDLRDEGVVVSNLDDARGPGRRARLYRAAERRA